MKTHGDRGWETLPSYLNLVVPRVLDLLDRWNLKITFFIVGQDAALEKNRKALSLITKGGHEAGNHSFNHEPWLHLYEKDRIRKEIQEAEESIEAATGQKPIGFRGPGFSWSGDLLEVLVERGYLYDASILPTFLGPLARRYYFWTSDLSQDEKKERARLFGGFKEGLRPVSAYQWRVESGTRILEIPITTVPGIRTPFHLSYLLYLSRFSEMLMKFYLNLAVSLCRARGIGPSYLLHPLDLIGGNETPELAFFPGMDLSSERKKKVFDKVIGLLSRRCQLVKMDTHARTLLGKEPLRTVQIERG